MSVSNYKRYLICPECNNEIVADRLLPHFKRAHKQLLSAAQMAEILSHVTREPTRKPNPPPRSQCFSIRQKKRERAEIENKMKKFDESTPFSMRQWGVDRPHRTGPI